MDSDFDSDSTDRSTGDYILFAATFVGYLLLLAGIEISAPALAVLGFALTLFSVLLSGLGL